MSLQNDDTTAPESEESSGENPVSAQLASGSTHYFSDGFTGHLAPKAPLLLTHWIGSHCQDYTGRYWGYFTLATEPVLRCRDLSGKSFQILSRRFCVEMSAKAARVSAMLTVLICLAGAALKRQ